MTKLFLANDGTSANGLDAMHSARDSIELSFAELHVFQVDINWRPGVVRRLIRRNPRRRGSRNGICSLACGTKKRSGGKNPADFIEPGAINLDKALLSAGGQNSAFHVSLESGRTFFCITNTNTITNAKTKLLYSDWGFGLNPNEKLVEYWSGIQ